jgi:hypothetical protein
MTQLVEDITIKITLNHCEGDSTVLGGPNDLRETAIEMLKCNLSDWLMERKLAANYGERGLEINWSNTGLYEAPETGGGDN